MMIPDNNKRGNNSPERLVPCSPFQPFRWPDSNLVLSSGLNSGKLENEPAVRNAGKTEERRGLRKEEGKRNRSRRQMKNMTVHSPSSASREGYPVPLPLKQGMHRKNTGCKDAEMSTGAMKYSTDQAGNGQSPLNRLPFSLVVRLHKASNRGPGPQDIRTPALSRYRQTPTDTILLPAGEKLKKKTNVPDTAGQISGTTARFHHEQPQPSPLYKQKQPRR